MKNNYVGWQLFDKVIIVARGYNRWVNGKYINEGVQGYIVDPSNKKMLESARNWGRWTEYGEYVQGEGYPNKVEHEPEEFTFDNNDFTLELVDCAENSSQGGKLSFWNCNITKDGKTFLVGIAANLLLDVLKHNTFIDGKCQTPLMFARCKGGVGMLSENMESYKQALADMQLKKKVNTGKTSKHRLGHIYNTLTESHAYLADLYCWYEPITEEKRRNNWSSSTYDTIVGFKKLDKPIKLKWFASMYDKESNLSDFEILSWELKSKLPTRIEDDKIIEYDISVEECIDKYIDKRLIEPTKESLEYKARGLTRSVHMWDYIVGLSTSDVSYTLPTNVRDALVTLGYRIED